MHTHEIFPEKYLKQTVLTTPANINKPTVPGMQGNTYYSVATPLNSIKTHKCPHVEKKIEMGSPM